MKIIVIFAFAVIAIYVAFTVGFCLGFEKSKREDIETIRRMKNFMKRNEGDLK